MSGRLIRQPSSVRAFVAIMATAIASALALVGGSTPAAAHDNIESSNPANLAELDDPISVATVDFGEVISDDVQLFLTYDPGDGSTVDIGGEVTKTGDTTARIDFDELTVEGTYFLRYFGPVPADGHVIIGATSFTFGEPTVTNAVANADIRASTPGSRQRLDEPITAAEIAFVAEIGDDPVLTLVYDRGDGENFDELDGVTTKLDDNTVRLEFDSLPQEGTYFVRYDTTIAATGEELVGATSFTWGNASGTSSFPVIPVAAASLLILAVGAWFTSKRMRQAELHIHEDLAD